MMLAARRFWVPGLIATLMELAADPAKRDAEGRTALDYLDAQEKISPYPYLYKEARRRMVARAALPARR